MKDTKVLLCKDCEGYGKIYERTYVDGGENVTCPGCKGSGKVIQITETKPYVEPKPKCDD